MWIISFAPEWVFHVIFGLGVLGTIAGFVLGFIPVIRQYKLPIQIISILTLILGVYLEGALADYREWEMKAAELKVKIADMETKLAQSDTKIVEKVVVKTELVKQKGKDVVKYVDREIVKYDTKFLPGGQCEIPQEFYKAYNDSLSLDLK
jgi:uncharacterized membrane protein